MSTETSVLDQTPLGKTTSYCSEYTPDLLFPISRKEKRAEIGIYDKLPFHGVDIWNAYEISWLNPKGKPQVAIAEFSIPCESPFLIESKSLKLYFNSFNLTIFKNLEEVRLTILQDLNTYSESSAAVKLYPPEFLSEVCLKEFHAQTIDHLDIEADEYQVNPDLLKLGNHLTEEALSSNLFKSNCLVTGQPDWASIYIHYKGQKIDHASLLRYLISYREHSEFHEQCIERIYVDLLNVCKPEKLTVNGKYTRRGGLDINPFRSNFETPLKPFVRTPRQ